MKNYLNRFILIVGFWKRIRSLFHHPIILCSVLMAGTFSVSAHALIPVQDVVITGTVSDAETGETIPGVNVIVRGTSYGTATDAMGRFSLSFPNEDAVLVFSFIG